MLALAETRALVTIGGRIATALEALVAASANLVCFPGDSCVIGRC